MTRDEIVELAAGYALGSLEGEERERFEALLRAGDAAATSALREFEETLAALASGAAATPPPGIREDVLARLDAGPHPASVIRAAGRRRGWWPAIWTGAAAAGIAAILVGMALSSSYERRLAGLTREAAGLRAEIDALRGEIGRQQALIALIRDPASHVVPLAGQPAAPQARARVVWNSRAGGLLVAAGLPALPEGKTYQLWAIAGKAAPVPAGVFGVDATGGASVRIAPVPAVATPDVFAVTLEPAGGLPAPSGPMVLAGRL